MVEISESAIFRYLSSIWRRFATRHQFVSHEQYLRPATIDLTKFLLSLVKLNFSLKMWNLMNNPALHMMVEEIDIALFQRVNVWYYYRFF